MSNFKDVVLVILSCRSLLSVNAQFYSYMYFVIALRNKSREIISLTTAELHVAINIL